MPQLATAASTSILFLLCDLPLGVAGAEFGEQARPYWIAHGTLMFLAWGVLFPIGALIALYRKHVGYDSESSKTCFVWAPNFYLPHFYFQMTGLLLNIIAFASAARGSYLEYQTGNPFDTVLWDFETDLYPWNHHVKWGVTVLLILVIQCILGYTHHRLKHAHDEQVKYGLRLKWTRPVVPSWAHVIIGPLICIIAYLTLIQGFQIFVVIYYHTPKAPNAAIKFGYSAVSISATCFVVAYLYGRVHSAKPPEVKGSDRHMEIQPLSRSID